MGAGTHRGRRVVRGVVPERQVGRLVVVAGRRVWLAAVRLERNELLLPKTSGSVGPMLPWGTPDKAAVRRQLLIPAGVGLLVTVICYAAGLRGGG